MKELISIFQENKKEILDKIIKKIEIYKIDKIKNEDLHESLFYFTALESIYSVNRDFVQLSPIFNKDLKHGDYKNKIKYKLKNNVYLENKEYFISAPYISAKSNKFIVTLVKKLDDRLIAFDFDFYKLLKEHKYIDVKTKLFMNTTKIVYGIIGLSLTVFALILVFYAVYDFSNNILTETSNIFNAIFKSAIALTLGLAIFDLAKNLLEHEVIFKNEVGDDHGGNQLLMKFMTSIIIALAIESLMMVFKMALNDYKDTINAVYLLLAIAFMLISMSYFNKDLKK